MKRFVLSGVLLAGLLLAGCRSGEDFSRLAEEVPPLASEEVREKRLENFRKAWEKVPVRAIQEDYQELSPYHKKDPKRWIGTLTRMGCSRLILTIRPETDLDWPALEEIAEAAAGKMELFFELEQKDYVQPFRGTNRLLRPFTGKRQTLSDKCSQIRRFNRGLSRKAKLSGVILTAQPDYFTDYHLTERPKDLLFSWAPDRYGLGGSNDAVMRYTVQQFQKCIRDSSRIPFVIGMPDFTHDAVMKKKLSFGSVRDFAELGTHPGKEVLLTVLVEVKNDKPYFRSIDRELADGGGRIIVRVDVASHGAEDKGTGMLPRQNWDGMCLVAKFYIPKWRKKPSFGGITVGPWHAMESILGAF